MCSRIAASSLTDLPKELFLVIVASLSVSDHDRLRMFNDYGVTFHQFYSASTCYEAPEDVVNDFLARLARS
jgi:hypothetical protein